MFRTARHLTSRFFGVVFSRPLAPQQQDWVNRLLRPDEASLFWEQDAVDQRHAFEVAQRVQDSLGGDRPALAAALLHDVGKRHSDAGPIGRSLATVLDAVHLPLPGDWRRYRDHGALGASDLEGVGADQLSIAFARGHRDEADAVGRSTWDVLRAADDA